MKPLGMLILCACLAAAEGAPRPDPSALREGLDAPDRAAREWAARAVRRWSLTDPAGAAGLWENLGLRGRCLLVRSLASAGTRHAAQVAMKRAAPAEPEVFHALLLGLTDGGRTALFAKAPETLPAGRQAALASLRLRWRVEEEMARLKSPSGLTGHYTGQYDKVKSLGRAILPVFFAMLEDRAFPLPGEGAAGPYRSIHPWMVRFEREEMRNLAGYAFAEIVDPKDHTTIQKLITVFWKYWRMSKDRHPVEREELAPTLAFSLHDLGVKGPAQRYLQDLHRRANYGGYEAWRAWWDLGYAYIRLGQPDRGADWYQRVLDNPQVSRGVAAYNLACNFSMRAMREPARAKDFKEQSVKYLRMAIVKFKYTDWQWMEEDRDLDFIRKEPGYQELLKYLKTKYPARTKGRISKELKDFLAGKDVPPEAKKED